MTADVDRLDRVRDASGLVAAVIILAVTVIRVTSFFAPQLVFDADPLLAGRPMGGWSPAGSLWMNVIVLAACGLGLWSTSKRGLHRLWIIAALCPWPVVLMHGLGDAGHLWRGVDWATSLLAAVTVAHLARTTTLRWLLIAVLIGAIAPVLARGAMQITTEHTARLDDYAREREAFLADRGWAPDSSQARIFERRLEQRQPSGWFVTANVFGSLAAVTCIVGLGLAVVGGARGRRRETGWRVVLGAAGLLAFVGVVLTGSKGAIGATLIGFAVSAIAWRFDRGGPWRTLLPLACIGLTLAAVVARGALLPEGFAGERSLLFRWHYMTAAAQVFEDAPLVGAGPDGFQVASVKHRHPRNPEEVTSPHSVFLDWLTGLGVFGVAWAALTTGLLFGAARGRDDETPAELPVRAGTIMLVAAVGGLVPALFVEAADLGTVDLFARIAGVAGFVFLTAATWRALAHGSARLVDALLLGAVTALFVHGQIEMTLTQPGSCLWAFVLLGAMSRLGDGGGRRAWCVGIPFAVAALTVLVAVVGAVPAARSAAGMTRAAMALWSLGRESTRDDVRRARLDAAQELAATADAWPIAPWPRLAAADQLTRAAAQTNREDAAGLLTEALVELESCRGLTMWPHARGRMIAVHRGLAQLTGDAEHELAALTLARQAADDDPRGLVTWVQVADLEWAYGELERARAADARVLEIDRAFELDPLKQLTDVERARIRGRHGKDAPQENSS